MTASDRERVRLLNLRQRLRRAIKEGAEDHVLRDLIEDINETTDRLLDALTDQQSVGKR